jgi:hypothetical protein
MANLFDPANAPEGEPLEVTVGDFIQWKRSDLSGDYPNDLYTMSYVYHLVDGSGPQPHVTGVALGDDYLFTVTSAQSAQVTAGTYKWQLEVVKNSDGNRAVVDRGQVEFVADIDIAGVDLRTHAEIMVQKIQSVLDGKADSDVANYSIGGRSISKMTFDELMNARDRYRAEVLQQKNRELAKRGKQGGATVKVRFV